MISIRLSAGIAVFACFAAFTQPSAADTYKVILRGKVVMADGSPPPKTVGIQRICSDSYGDAPGPITNKKGEFIWQMDFDNMLTRACRLEAQLAGYASSAIDISDINGFISSDKVLPPLVLHVRGSDPRVIVDNDNDVPGPAKAIWKSVPKLISSGNLQGVVDQLKAVVAAAPNFARGWDSLGIAYETLNMSKDARDAYLRATQIDPKMTIAYVTLSREDVLNKDWQGAVDAANTAIKLDIKHMYPEVYLHLAAAQYELKDLDAAEASVKKSLAVNAQERKFRGELILGQILAAKGDIPGAREHVAKYLQLAKNAPDAQFLQVYLDNLGKPEATAVPLSPELP